MSRTQPSEGSEIVLGSNLTAGTTLSRWLRLVKNGDEISAYQSLNGSSWQLVAETVLPMVAQNFYVGLAVCGNTNSQLCQATFESVNVLYNLPPQEARLSLWLRTDAGVVADLSGNISRWEDQSGYENHALQAVSASQPQLVVSGANLIDDNFTIHAGGLPSSRFFNLSNTTSLKPAQLTLFVVGKQTNASAFSSYLITGNDNGSNGYGMMFDDSSTNGGFWVHNFVNANGSSVDATIGTSVHQFTGRYDLANVKLFLDGTLSASRAYTNGITYDSSSLFIGKSLTSARSDIYVSEILLYSEALSDLDRGEVEAYLAQKYNLQGPPAPAPLVSSTAPRVSSSSRQVTLESPVTNGVIRYTLDGSEPSESSAIYTGPITINATTTVKARVFKPGYRDGDLLNAKFVVNSLATFNMANVNLWLRSDLGVELDGSNKVTAWRDQSGKNHSATYGTSSFFPGYSAMGGPNSLPIVSFANQRLDVPDHVSLKPSQVTVALVFKDDGSGQSTGSFLTKGTWNSGYAVYRDSSATNWGFRVNAQATGANTSTAKTSYIVTVGVYDGVTQKLYVNGVEVTSVAKAETITYNTEPLRLGYGLNSSGSPVYVNMSLAEAIVIGEAFGTTERQKLEEYLLSRYNISATLQAAQPVASKPSGLYGPALQVGLSTATAGAEIRYTTNGTDPTAASTLYTSPLAVNSTTTLKFKAFKSGYTASTTATETYAVDATAAFDKTQLLAWFRADQGITMDGSNNVSEWKDMSGHSYHAANSTAAARPQYLASGGPNSKPALRFVNAHRLATADDAGLEPQNLTVVTVFKDAGTTQNYASYVRKGTYTNGYGLGRWTAASTEWGFWINARTSPGATTLGLPSGFAVAIGTYDGTTEKFFMDGSLIASNAKSGPITYDAAGLNIGANSSAESRSDIAEVLVFGQALGIAARQEVEQYLKTRYAVGGSVAEAPQVNVNGGFYTTAQQVELTSATPGAEIRYTTDGSEPTASSSLYTGPLTINSSMTLKFKAFKSGYTASATMIQNYAIELAADFSKSQLLAWYRSDQGITLDGSGKVSEWKDLSGHSYHATNGTAAARPLFVNDATGPNAKPYVQFTNAHRLTTVDDAGLEPQNVTVAAILIDHGTSQNYASYVRKGAYTTGYGLSRWTNASGEWGFWINSRTVPAATTIGFPSPFKVVIGTYDGTTEKFYIDGVLVASNTKSGPITYDTSGLVLGASSGAESRSSLAEVLVFGEALGVAERQKVEQYFKSRYNLGTSIVETPEAGAGIYPTAQQVTFSCATPGAELRYTTNGTEPTVSSTLYTTPLAVNSTTTFKVKGFKSGYTSSATATFNYVIDSQAVFDRSQLLAWYRADQGIAVDGSGNVSEWKDLSGHGYDLSNATASERPQYLATGGPNAKPVLYFQLSQPQRLKAADHAGLKPGQVTVVTVLRDMDTTGNYGSFVRNGAYNKGYGLGNWTAATGQSGFWINAKPTTAATTWLSSDNYYVMMGMYDGASEKLFLNGSLLVDVSRSEAIVYDGNGLMIGANPAYSSHSRIAEVLVFGTGLSSMSAKAVNKYLSDRYQIATSLQVDSPTFMPRTTFSDSLAVTISVPEGATVRYTTNGSTPNGSSPLYDPQNPPVITQTTTFKAIALRSGWTSSPVAVSPAYTKEAASIFPRNGLAAWYKADGGFTYISGFVLSWMDESGQGNDLVQPTSGDNPIYSTGAINGLPAMHFDGANYWMSAPHLAAYETNETTVFMVAKYEGTATADNWGALVQKSTTTRTEGWGLTRTNSDERAGLWVNNSVTTRVQGTLPSGRFALAEASFTQNELRLSLNGVPTDVLQVGDQTAFGHHPLYVGGTGTSGSYFQGKIAEILIFNRQLTWEEKVQVEKYLGQKYALTTDADGDGLPNWLEAQLGSNPSLPDSNGDGLPDGSAYNSGYSVTGTDSDGDGMSNANEYTAGTNPFWPDSDGDGVNDNSDPFPLDPGQTTFTDPTPATAPTITLERPSNAVLVP